MARDFYGRQLKDWKGSAEIEQMEPERNGPYGKLCGWTLARAHARSGDRIAIAAYLGKSDTFDRAILDVLPRLRRTERSRLQSPRQGRQVGQDHSRDRSLARLRLGWPMPSRLPAHVALQTRLALLQRGRFNGGAHDRSTTPADRGVHFAPAGEAGHDREPGEGLRPRVQRPASRRRSRASSGCARGWNCSASTRSASPRRTPTGCWSWTKPWTRRQRRHERPRHERGQSTGRGRAQLQGALGGGAQSRLPVALPTASPRARRNRHLQPLAL